MSAVSRQVARGAALLDEKIPGWAARIDLARLQMNSCHACVVGQLFPVESDWVTPYGKGMAALGVWDLRGDAAGHGFDGEDADALNTEWRRVIVKRRMAVPEETAAVS